MIYKDPVLPAIFTGNQLDLRGFDRDLISALNDWSLIIKAILDRGIAFGDNVDCRIVSYTSNAVADTEDTVAHTLGKAPIGFVVIDIDKAGVVYRGSTSFSTTNVYLKCSAGSAALKILLF